MWNDGRLSPSSGNRVSRCGIPMFINLWDSDKRVHVAAVDAPGTIGDQRAYDYLVKMPDDPDHDVRFASIIALGKLGDMQAVEPLSRACHDPNYYIRTIAAEILEKFGLRT